MNLTKREKFAAMAMQGFIGYCFSSERDEHQLARWSVIAADALIKELNIKDQIESKKRMEEAQIAPAFSHFYDGYMD